MANFWNPWIEIPNYAPVIVFSDTYVLIYKLISIIMIHSHKYNYLNSSEFRTFVWFNNSAHGTGMVYF